MTPSLYTSVLPRAARAPKYLFNMFELYKPCAVTALAKNIMLYINFNLVVKHCIKGCYDYALPALANAVISYEIFYILTMVCDDGISCWRCGKHATQSEK